jgi:hypothetical protein
MLHLTFATIKYTLTVDLGLIKKSAHWYIGGYPNCCPMLKKRRGSNAARTSFSSFCGGP